MTKIKFKWAPIFKRLTRLVPAIRWLPKYKLNYLPMDILAGLTVGIVNVPQGMAYGLLAGVDPVYGLYTSLFFPLIYTFFGTSKHAAVGTFAVTSIMTSSLLDRMEVSGSPIGVENVTDSFWCGRFINMSSQNMGQRVDIATTLTLMVAAIHLLCGCLKLGFLTVLLSDQLIQGLTTGAAFHVLTSQVKHLFGLEKAFKGHVRSQSELLGLLRFYVCFFMEITKANWIPMVLSAICIAILVVVKLYIDPKTRPKIRFPIPIELILVIVTTIISWQLDLKQYSVAIVDNIPVGLPSPKVPPIGEYFQELLPDAISIGIMLYAIEVSIAKLFAAKYNYKINPNQEWFGLGSAHLFGAFFQCIPGGASMSRSMVQGSQGGKTQLVNFINSMVIFAVLVSVAQMFQNLPKCTLSAIILVSLKGLFLQLKSLPDVWRRSKLDFIVWISTFLGVILFNVTFGLIIGSGVGILTLLYRIIWPKSSLDEEVFQDFQSQKSADQPDVKIFRFGAPISYINVKKFKEALYRKTEMDPLELKRKKIKEELKSKEKPPFCLKFSKSAKNTIVLSTISSETNQQRPCDQVIIDCSPFDWLDIMAVDNLIKIFEEYKEVNINVYFAQFSEAARNNLQRSNFFEKVPETSVFLCVPSAVTYALQNGQ